MPTERVRKLLAEAATLPEEERAELVNELARTLPEEYAQSVEYEELDRRMESVRDGTATLIPWEEARKRLCTSNVSRVLMRGRAPPPKGRWTRRSG